MESFSELFYQIEKWLSHRHWPSLPAGMTGRYGKFTLTAPKTTYFTNIETWQRDKEDIITWFEAPIPDKDNA